MDTMLKKCLIIAAGRGSRIREKGAVKPLVPVLGVPLIERVINEVLRAGIRDIYVVTGYNGKRVEKFLKGLNEKYNINITVIPNDEWEKENGISVLKAQEHINENFLLLMGDHLVDPDIIKEAVRLHLPYGYVALGVDKNIDNGQVNPEDVTKVYTSNGKILKIGKTIDSYNGYDTGVFVCSPAIFDGIKESIKRGDSSLTGGISCLAEKGKVNVFDIGKRTWIDIDDSLALKKAEDTLLNKINSKDNDGPVSRYLNRRFSIRISRLIARFNITPNQITVFSFMLSFVASLLIAQGSYIWLIAGGLLAQLSSIIDGCDGEIARLKNMQTEFGAWFDAVLDRYADAFLLSALCYHIYQNNPQPMVLFLGLMALIGSFMVSYTAHKYDAMRKKGLWKSFRIGRDLRLFIIFVGSILNLPLLTLILLAVIMNGEALRRIYLMKIAIGVKI